MNKIYIVLIIIVIFYLITSNNINLFENFDGVTDLEEIEKNPIFVSLYTDKGKKLNVTLISKPFGGPKAYKQYLVNKPNKIYLGITSYMEFPYIPSNPNDKYYDVKNDYNGKPSTCNKYHLDMYLDICDGWLHCFKNDDLQKYLPTNKPKALISESDFVNFKRATPITPRNERINKKYDYIYSCPKVKETSTCDDWVSYNKNWPLAEKCIQIFSDMGLKGLLVGRKGCKVPKNCDTTGWVEYKDMLKLYDQAKFLFLPNEADASPRVLTECLSIDLPCLVNKNIIGGWKYVNNNTGEFFTNETDVKESVTKLMSNIDKYEPRKYIVENYGPINSGKRLKEFLYKNYKDKLNIPENEVDFVILRHPLINF